jgi:hypothetical protein
MSKWLKSLKEFVTSQVWARLINTAFRKMAVLCLQIPVVIIWRENFYHLYFWYYGSGRCRIQDTTTTARTCRRQRRSAYRDKVKILNVPREEAVVYSSTRNLRLSPRPLDLWDVGIPAQHYTASQPGRPRLGTYTASSHMGPSDEAGW